MRDTNPWKWVHWPSAATLAITALRLAGELLHWAPALFSRAVGGGGSVISIIWLVPIFGAYFGYRLAHDQRSALLGRALGWDASQFLAIGVGSWAAIAVAGRGWPTLVAKLVRSGVLARLPGVLVVLRGILGNWGTHYDSPPPVLPELGTFSRWIAIGVIPQLTLWMAVTVVVGVLTGLPAAALARAISPRPTEA